MLTNDRDKVDLDTGCPGWGPSKPSVGPSRCGENADLILNETSLTVDQLPASLCVKTDKESIAAVRVETVGGGVEISFVVWAP